MIQHAVCFRPLVPDGESNHEQENDRMSALVRPHQLKQLALPNSVTFYSLIKHIFIVKVLKKYITNDLVTFIKWLESILIVTD